MKYTLIIRSLIRDVFGLIGIGFIGVGCWLISPSLSFIVTGGLFLGMAVFGEWQSRPVVKEPK